MGIQERKEREKERRRQQIMIAARRVFSNNGFNRATMEDIAKEAELSPGTLYLYFKNKDELYVSLSIRILQYLLIRLEHVKNKSLNAEESLDALQEAMIDVYDFDPTILINLFHLQSSEILKSVTPELLSQIKSLSQKSFKIIAYIMAKNIKYGSFIDQHPMAVANIYWSLFSGVILWETSKKIINNDKGNLKEILETAFKIFNRGILK